LSATNISIDLTSPDLSFQSGHLRMGGSSPAGVEINANSRFLTLGGSAWFPVMGEFHFSRYPAAEWRDELLKMKAGGIQVVATYIFWNHHEEIQGRFDWDGNRDLRRFVELCAALGLYSYPRIGPWAHGEARRGGFPDWLAAACPRTRQDDLDYLKYVEIFYRQIAAQLNGLLWKDGGPVIGIQLENELADQPEHIRTLKRVARTVGFDVPLYTMTGWGLAQVPQDEVIPVFGGYPDAPWDHEIEGWSRDSRKLYFFSPVRDQQVLGGDLRADPNAPDQAYLARYPFGTCELGGGVQVTYHRRPYIQPQDISAIALSRLGSGANWLGYYMYHGGTQPLGQLSTLQESQDTGYPNDLPVRSYDFQAPLGESGQVREHYHRLRLLHLFLQDFGAQMAHMPSILPDRLPPDLDNRSVVRWAARSDGDHGFIFINNYQRIENLPVRLGVQFELRLKEAVLRLPAAPLAVPARLHAIWPIHLDLGGVRLVYATAQPVCRLDSPDLPCFVFAADDGLPAEFAFDGGGKTISVSGWRHEPETPLANLNPIEGRAGIYQLSSGVDRIYTVTRGDQPLCNLILLSVFDALRCWKARMWGAERIFLSPAALLFDGESLRLRAAQVSDLWFSVYPALPAALRCQDASLTGINQGPFTFFQIPQSEVKCPVAARRLQPAGPARAVSLGPAGVAQSPDDADFEQAEIWQVDFPEGLPVDAAGVRLRVDYTGDAARAYLGSELVSDDFYAGRPWEIGLRRLDPQALAGGLVLKFLPLRRNAPIYLPGDWRSALGPEDALLEVRAIRAVVEVEAAVSTMEGLQ
jgi:beta-galactosidase